MTKYLFVVGMTSAIRSPDVEGGSNTVGGGHQLARRDQELFSGAKGGMHVRHEPLPRRHQMVFHQGCGADGSPQVHLPALLAAGSVTTELPDNLR